MNTEQNSVKIQRFLSKYPYKNFVVPGNYNVLYSGPIDMDNEICKQYLVKSNDVEVDYKFVIIYKKD